MKPGTTPKEKLFHTAARLFFEQGYRAVGVDTIAGESGVGKMTLYRHFPSKDDLITAYLGESDRAFWAHFERSTRDAPNGRAKLEAFFASLQAYILSPVCHGCPFNNLAAEFPEAGYPGHQLALAHKQAVRDRFEELARQADAAQPARLAKALLLLMDGAYMAARLYGASGSNPATGLAEAARHLIDAHCQKRGSTVSLDA